MLALSRKIYIVEDANVKSTQESTCLGIKVSLDVGSRSQRLRIIRKIRCGCNKNNTHEQEGAI